MCIYVVSYTFIVFLHDGHQPINEIVVSGLFVREEAIRWAVDGDISSGRFPMYTVNKFIGLVGDSGVEEINDSTANFKGELNGGLKAVHKRKEL